MKSRHNPTLTEEREIARRIIQRLSTQTDRELMSEFNVSRTVISRIKRECKVYFQPLSKSQTSEYSGKPCAHS